MGATAVAEFSRAGASVFGLDIDQERGASTAESTGSTYIHCDVTDSSSVARAFDAVEEAHGRLDVLVNNAGGFWEQLNVERTSEEEWDRVIDLNLKSVFLCARHSIPLLKRSSGGRIITVGSMAAQTTLVASSPPYAAAKAGAIALSRVLAFELAADGITSNAISPSTVLTDRVRAVRSPEERARAEKTIPLGRFGEPNDIVWWMLFLGSEESAYMTGQTVGVNGGRLMV